MANLKQSPRFEQHINLLVGPRLSRAGGTGTSDWRETLVIIHKVTDYKELNQEIHDADRGVALL
jgi:hypothetical protein